MKQVNILCLCEGYSEKNLVSLILAPHLSEFGISITAPIVKTRRNKKAGKVSKGGSSSFQYYRNDLIRMYNTIKKREHQFLTTLIDLYALPNDFPGYAEGMNVQNCYQKVEKLENSLQEDMNKLGIPPKNFIPHVQLHEFETLILSDPQKLEVLFPDKTRSINKLKESINKFSNVEEINHTPQKAPSKRIATYIPIYGSYKASHTSGAITIIEEIGLEKIRNQCKHFNEWIEKLENLAKT